MNNQFESFGEHIRNIITPYGMIIQMLEDITKDGASSKMKNTLIQFLLDKDKIKTYRNNFNHLIEFSNIDELEKMNWRDTKLFEKYSSK